MEPTVVEVLARIAEGVEQVGFLVGVLACAVAMLVGVGLSKG